VKCSKWQDDDDDDDDNNNNEPLLSFWYDSLEISFFKFFKVIPQNSESRHSSVGIALVYGLDDRGSTVLFPTELGIFLFTTASRTALGLIQCPVQWVPWALSLG
jgi:hypothetical protein